MGGIRQDVDSIEKKHGGEDIDDERANVL